MPYLSITTNAALTTEAETALADAASKIVAAGLGKPEAYVMISVQSKSTVRFAGSEEPAAFLDIKSIGLPANLNDLSRALTDTVTRHANVSARRVFIAFTDVSASRFALGGVTFA